MAVKRNARDRILSVATEKFSRYGFYKTTIEEIARDAHISKGLIYHYFPDKEDLYMCFIEQEACKILEEAKKTVAGATKTTRDRLILYVRIKCKWMEQIFVFKELETLCFWYDRDELRARMRKLAEMDLDFVQGILKEGVARGDIKPGAVKQHAMILATVTDPVYWSTQFNFYKKVGIPSPEPSEMVKAALKVIMDGICTT